MKDWCFHLNNNFKKELKEDCNEKQAITIFLGPDSTNIVGASLWELLYFYFGYAFGSVLWVAYAHHLEPKRLYLFFKDCTTLLSTTPFRNRTFYVVRSTMICNVVQVHSECWLANCSFRTFDCHNWWNRTNLVSGVTKVEIPPWHDDIHGSSEPYTDPSRIRHNYSRSIVGMTLPNHGPHPEQYCCLKVYCYWWRHHRKYLRGRVDYSTWHILSWKLNSIRYWYSSYSIDRYNNDCYRCSITLAIWHNHPLLQWQGKEPNRGRLLGSMRNSWCRMETCWNDFVLFISIPTIYMNRAPFPLLHFTNVVALKLFWPGQIGMDIPRLITYSKVSEALRFTTHTYIIYSE